MRRILAATALVALTATLAFADDPKPSAADAKAQMDAMVKAATPGDAHKKLGPMVGTFTASIKTWMQPGQPPLETSGVSENTWALDGRWVEQRYNGTFMGMPFKGIGYTGYDNIKKKYVGTWMDNMSTWVMSSTGTAEGNAYTFTSTMDDPVTGKPSPIKQKVTVVDDDHHTMEMWSTAPDGSMYKVMEIAYSRKK